MTAKNRSRRLLLTIGLCFAAPMLLALALQQIGWMPQGRKNYGELLAKPIALATVHLNDGSEFRWKTPDWYWTLLVRIPDSCSVECRARLELVPNLRQSLDRHAIKLRIAVADALPEGSALFHGNGIYLLHSAASDIIDTVIQTPQADIQLAMVDPNGYVILRYPENADFSQVRKDLTKLVK